jgi:hypothetical protein
MLKKHKSAGWSCYQGVPCSLWGRHLRQRLYTVIEQTGPRWGGRIYIGRRLAVRVSGGAAYIRNVVELVGMVSAGVAIDHNPDGRRLMLILREHGLTPG